MKNKSSLSSFPAPLRTGAWCLRIIPASAVLLAWLSTAAHAQTSIPFFYGELNQLSDNSAAYLINHPGSASDDVTLDEGDRVRGIFHIETLEDQTGGGGTHSLADTTTELTGVYDVTVVKKTLVSSAPDFYTYDCAPTPVATAWPGSGAAPGTMLRFYEDSAKDYTRLLASGQVDDGDPGLAGADIGNGPFATEEALLATATGGNAFWDLGFTGTDSAGNPIAAAGEGCSQSGGDNVLAIRSTPPPTYAAFFNFAFNLTGNHPGIPLGPVPSGFGGTANINGSGSVLGVEDVNTPYDFFSDINAAIRPAPPVPGIDIEKLTNGNDADRANDGDVPQIAPGDTVTWTYVVTNTGETTYAFGDVVVTDDQFPTGVTPVFVPGAGTDDGQDGLSPGEVWHYTATLAAENLLTSTSGVQIVAGCDPDQTGITRPTYENIGTVVAGDQTDEDPSHYCNPPAPGIDIEKLTNDNQADEANDGDVPQIAPDDTVTWTYKVTNTGNLPFALAEVAVSDDQPGVFPAFDSNSDNGDNILSPGEVWLYTATLPAENLLTTTNAIKLVDGCDPNNTELTRKTYENIGTVVAGENTDFDPSHYCNPPEPGIDIEKLTNDNQADGANDADVPQIAPGDTVTWTYRVTNTGNQPFALAEVTVTDDQPGVSPALVPTSDNGDNILSPGEEWLYKATLPAENLSTSQSGADIVPGCDPGNTGTTRPTYENLGKVVAGTETDEDPSHYCNPKPGIDIEKLTNGNQADGANDGDVPQIAPGDTVTWTYVVTNTGEVAYAFNAVVVRDDQFDFTGVTPTFVPAAGTDDGDSILSPGEVWHYVAEQSAEELATSSSGVTIVAGCDPGNTGNTRKTYENVATVVAATETDSDPSHYCNPPPAEVVACRFTGGLNDIFETEAGENRYQAGGQVGASTGAQPQPKGEWTHHQQSGPAGDFTFHGGTASAPEGTEIDAIRCSDPGGCKPSGNPPSPVKQLDFDGIGTFKNIGKSGNKVPDFVTAGATVTAEGNGNKDFDGTFHWFEVNIDDLGEPGNTNPKKNPGDADTDVCPLTGFGEKGAKELADCSCSDFYRITIYDGVDAADIVKNADGSIDPSQLNRTDVIYEVWGYIDGGNLQLHHPTGFDTK